MKKHCMGLSYRKKTFFTKILAFLALQHFEFIKIPSSRVSIQNFQYLKLLSHEFFCESLHAQKALCGAGFEGSPLGKVERTHVAQIGHEKTLQRLFDGLDLELAQVLQKYHV